MSSAGISNLSNPGAAASGVLDQRLSLDVQGVDALRRTARTSPQEGMKQASRQFEVRFLQMMLKSMRDAASSESMLSSSQEKTYTAMLDQQLSQNLSGRGLGLAEAMFTQLSRAMVSDAPAAAASGPLPGATSPGWRSKGSRHHGQRKTGLAASRRRTMCRRTAPTSLGSL